VPMPSVPPAFPDGHFYSPVVRVEEARDDRPRIWPATPSMPAIDLNPRRQRAFLTHAFARYIREYRCPERHNPIDSSARSV